MPTKILLFFLMTILVCTPCAFAGEVPENPEEEPFRGIRYETVITGEMETRIRQSLNHISDTISLEDRPPMTITQLHRRAWADVREFTEAFRSFGFYSPEIEYTIDEKSTPVMVEFQIDPGPAYLIREVSIVNICPEMTPLPELPSPEELNLEPGSRIHSERVQDALQLIARHVRNKGFPFPLVGIEKVIINHQDHSAYIEYGLDPGPEAIFGRTGVSGLNRVREEYIFERLTWEKGDPFRASLMDDLRRQLIAGGLFTIVEVTHAQELEDDAHLPIKINVTERSPRTARAGLAYQTDIGPELRLGWVHRNLRGKGQQLEFDLNYSDIMQSIEAGYTIPGWRRPDQNLIFRSGFVREDTDAFDSDSLFATAMLERMLTDNLSAAAGVGYRASRIKRLGQTDEQGLFFIPTDLTWDGRDDVLNPGTGMRLNLKVTPFFDTFDPENRFVKTYASASTYLELMSEKRIVLANRIAVGSINAESRSKLPPDELFYAGGGGSIRGYSFQTAGQLENSTPVGGLSLAEINNEIRFKVTERSGLVLFLDGGRAFNSWYPDFDEDLFWAWGLGYRFFTDFGPIRADIAFPIDRRDVDDRFQVYISLGQAF